MSHKISVKATEDIEKLKIQSTISINLNLENRALLLYKFLFVIGKHTNQNLYDFIE